ncbi:RPW8.2-like protein [Melia azedarach]|uniref:RPW8.2-like protein n=1 Tax=Melia azedarach TaxID=155640 RepID=A0ACC1XTX0_MELAZ|nr:RPW8.2-like protein [Melia azedarach]
MAEGLIPQALLGAAVDRIYRAIFQAFKRVVKFESIIEGLRTTVSSVTSEIDRISQLESHTFLQDQICKLMLLLKQAEELINICSKIARWNYYKKYRYSKKLLELDASLSRLSMDLPPPVLLQILDKIMQQNQILDRMLHDRDPDDMRHHGSTTKVKLVVTALKKIVQSLPIWIHSYFSLLTGIRRPLRGYQRITASFCPKYGKGG